MFFLLQPCRSTEHYPRGQSASDCGQAINHFGYNKFEMVGYIGFVGHLIIKFEVSPCRSLISKYKVADLYLNSNGERKTADSIVLYFTFKFDVSSCVC